jgi:hypothetical protein
MDLLLFFIPINTISVNSDENKIMTSSQADHFPLNRLLVKLSQKQ